MSPTSNRLLRWFKGLGHSGQMIWAIIVGATVILAALFSLAQQIVSHERVDTFVSIQDINSKIVFRTWCAFAAC